MPCALDLIFRIRKLFPKRRGNYVLGDGIMPTTTYPFDEEALENAKYEIAKYLKELGIDKKDQITLKDLTTYEDGTPWIKLQTMMEFDALELLLSCSHACGFIRKTPNNVKQTLSEIGEDNAILVSDSWIEEYSETEWLKAFRSFITGHTYFTTRKDFIEKYSHQRTQ